MERGGPQSTVSAARTMDSVMGATLANPRLMNGLMVLFARVAMIVAALGVYSIIAYGVERRTHAFGLPMALGAEELSLVGRKGGHNVSRHNAENSYSWFPQGLPKSMRTAGLASWRAALSKTAMN